MTIDNFPKRYYVYEYLDENDNPYYIGRGQKTRAWDKHKNIKVPEDQNKIRIVMDNLDDEESCFVEIGLIAHYGRKDIMTGILENQSDGSETLRLLRLRKERIQKGIVWKNGRKFLSETNPEATALATQLASAKKRKPSLRKIAHELEKAGFLSSTGKRYTTTSIQTMIGKEYKSSKNGKLLKKDKI